MLSGRNVFHGFTTVHIYWAPRIVPGGPNREEGSSRSAAASRGPRLPSSRASRTTARQSAASVEWPLKRESHYM
jgi:hypothetical protein